MQKTFMGGMFFGDFFFSINRLLKEMKPFYTCGAQNLSHFWFRQLRSQQYKHVTVMKSCAAFMNDSPLSSVSAVTVTSSLMGYFLLCTNFPCLSLSVGFCFVFLFVVVVFFFSLSDIYLYLFRFLDFSRSVFLLWSVWLLFFVFHACSYC